MPHHYTCKQCGVSGTSFDHRQRYCSISCTNKSRRRSNSEKFWPKVDQSGGSDACWPWRGGLSTHGYGAFVWVDPSSGRRHTLPASRVAFFLTHGYWPNYACHHCDNRPCCNPQHLYDGTPLDNNLDAIRRGRARRPNQAGKCNGNAKLTEADVFCIRSQYAKGDVSHATLGKRYGVAASTIRNVVNGERWKNGPWPEPADAVTVVAAVEVAG